MEQFDKFFNSSPLYNDENVSCIRVDYSNKEEVFQSLSGSHITLVGCSTGSVNVQFVSETVSLNPFEVMFVSNTNQCLSVSSSEDFRGILLCISEKLLLSMLKLDRGLQQIGLRLRKNRVIFINEELSKILYAYENLMEVKLSYSHHYLRETVYSIVRALLYDILSSVMDEIYRDEEYAANLKSADLLFFKFSQLLTKDDCTVRKLKYYADQLCVTPKYLSRACQETCGKTASALINDVMVKKITHYLDYTDLSIKEIANILDFPNISFFSKYVNKHLGCSPKAYRRRR